MQIALQLSGYIIKHIMYMFYWFIRTIERTINACQKNKKLIALNALLIEMYQFILN